MRNWVLIIVLFFCKTIFASSKEAVSGYYINMNNDTIHVMYKISTVDFGTEPNLEYLQKSIAIVDSNDKKQILLPSMASEIGFEFSNRIFIMVSRKSKYNTEPYPNDIFLHEKKIDNLSLFYKYNTVKYGGTTGSGFGGGGYSGGSEFILTYVLQNKNGALFYVPVNSFKKTMSKYFSICSELSNKILSKEFQYKDLEKIVDFYNINCKQ